MARRNPGASWTVGRFRITFDFDDDVHPVWRDAYEWAGQRWQRIIRSELPPVSLTGSYNCPASAGGPTGPMFGVERGTRVRVTAAPKTNAGGPCLRRAMPRPTTAVGSVTVSYPDARDLDPRTNLRGVAMHELGHVLGIAGYTYGIDGPVPWYDAGTRRYTGAFALEGFRRKFGTTVPYLDTPDVHWKGFVGDMMTQPPTGGITTLSVGALMDMGYPAAWYGADR